MFCANNMHAQDQRCGMEAHMQEMMKDPHFLREWESNQNKFKQTIEQNSNSNSRIQSSDNIVIPVAVHFPNGSESDRACLEALAQNQINTINGDFTATNPDANLFSAAASFYPGLVHGAANIEFCISTQNHPPGTDDDLVEGGPAVSIGYDFGGGNDADDNWSGYMNIVVKPIGALGSSPVGGSINAGQCVTIDDNAFGSGVGCSGSNVSPGAPYNLGRTLSHELGHFFNLSHVWGDGNCNVDDGITDTPLQDAANGGCPSPGEFPACVNGEFELSMNYMDYTDDACMYMFSQGQIDVVNTYVEVLQSQFKLNTTPVCVQTPEYIMSDNLVTTCNGIFYDSGGSDNGPNTGQYSNNEVFSYTICPENPGQSTQLIFSEFQTQNNADILSIYNAQNASDPTTLIGQYSGTTSPGTISATLTNISGCLTVVFTSNGLSTFSGWKAFISCIDPPAACQTIISELESSSPALDSEGIILVCPDEPITLNGIGQFSEPGGGIGAAYQWDIGDGSTLISGQSVTFSFDEPGVYIANLNIWDANTTVFPLGCKNDNLINQVIRVGTETIITPSDDTINTLCYGDSSTINVVLSI